MRTVVAALLASVAFSAHADFGAVHQVDLDTPGALARVQRDHPAHFRAITEILREAPYRRPQALSGWVRTAFNAKMASAMLIKTSYPPQARLEFVLDDTEYRALVTLRNVEPSVTPAEQR
jgi:fructose 1,6-bisphosphatase